MRIHIKKLKYSPFAIAAGIGLLDLFGGFLSVVSDIWWLAFDTLIKSQEFATHYIAYGFVMSGLVLAALILFAGIISTIYLIFKYSNSGILDAELKCELIHKKEIIQDKKRAKVFNRKDNLPNNTLKNKENVK